jgi:Domain of unknown function (DUF4397)
MRSSVTASIVLLAAVSTAASADVRVIHASPDTPPVDVYVNTLPGSGDPAITDLAFTQGTPYIPLPSGSYDFRVTPANSNTVALSALGFPVDQNQDVSIVAVNFLSSIEALVLNDDNTSVSNAARIRFVHAAPDVPTVDVALAGGDVLFNAVSFKGNGGYISVPGGTYDLEVRLDANNTVALPLPGVSVQNGFVYTIFAMGSLAAGNVQAVTFVDAIPAPGAAGLVGLAALAASRRRRA